MIEEVLEDSEDDVILENSPEKAGQIVEEYNIITDFSSPLKNDQETITDVSSPETDLSKISAIQGFSRKISHSRRNLFSKKKEPSFTLNTSKQNPTITLNEENIVDVSSHSSLIEENSPEVEVVNDDDSIDLSSNSSMVERTTIQEKKSSKDLDLMLKNESETCKLDESSSKVIKARKRGSLLQKAFQISSIMKKESILYSHELRVGLRTSQGYFVSDILIVKAVIHEKTYSLLECVSQNNFSVENEYVESLFIMVSTSVQGVAEDCCIVVHFPVICMLDLFSKSCLIFANERVQVISGKTSSNTLSSSSKIKINKSTTKRTKIFHTLKSRVCKNVLDAVIGYSLIHQHTLQLEILHIYNEKFSDLVYLKLLTFDSEKQFCILQLPYNDEISNTLQVGSIFTFTGFIMTECFDVTCKIRNAAEYYSSVIMKNDFIFLMEPVMKNWKIEFLQKSVSERTSVFTTLDKIIHQKFDEEKRFKLAVSAVNYNNSKVYIKDQSIDKYFYLNVCLQNQEMSFPSHPFLLEGVYLYKGDLCFDEFSRIETNVD